MKPFRDFLCWIGGVLARPTGADWNSYSKKQNSVNAFVLISIFATITCGFSEPIVRFAHTFRDAAPEKKTPRGDWNVLFPSTVSDSLKLARLQSPSVPSELWSSSATLGDPDHFQAVRVPENKVFWAGLQVSSSEAAEVLRNRASHLVIGHINASHKVFVNGELRHEGDGRDYIPVGVPLVPGDLQKPTGLHVAIQITQDLGSGRPIVVDSPYVNGFFTAGKLRSLRDRWVYDYVIDPLILGMAALLSSIAFFCLWLSVRDRNEYFLFAAFALCHFAMQLNNWGSAKFSVHRTQAYQLDTALGLLEACLAAMIGIAYARLRVAAYLGVIFLGGVFGIIVYRSAGIGSDFLYLSQFVPTFLGPACFAFGAIACFSQAAIGEKLGYPRMTRQKIELRVSRLRMFAFMILALGVIHLINAHRIVTIDAFAYWHRPLQYLIISMIGFFLFRDYREFDVLQQKVATSRFHDPLAKEQKVVDGYLLALDLKKSSHLYDLSAQLGLAKKIPTQWCELATEIVELKGGAKISSAGDSLIAFFEGDSEVVLRAAIAGFQGIQGLSHEFKHYTPELLFRGGLIRASIRPIYKKVSRKMYEDFEDAPGETGFKNLMRILETEKSLGLSDKSVLVVESSLGERIAGDVELVKKQKLSVRDVGERELHYFDLAARAGRTERSEAA